MSDRYEPEWWTEARKLHADGVAVPDIAGRMGVTRGAVYIALRDEASNAERRAKAVAWNHNNRERVRANNRDCYQRRRARQMECAS